LRSEILHRLNALVRVGLGYINLNRPSPTLSRGESQRVRLAIALSSPLEDILHILDEPTIGQHPSDVIRFLPAFRELPGPVVYVEHDRVAAAQADQIIDLGPGAGNSGGKVIFNGTPADLWDSDTPSGNYFSLRKQVLIPHKRTSPENFLSIKGAYLHNLKKIDVELPINRMTVITGVSGSGKSTFVEYVLVPSLLDTKPVGCQAIVGPKMNPVLVDQRPIGRNPRSNPATYTKFSDILRELYSDVTGLSASHFSFNRPDGACPTCKGMGALEVKMKYLSSVWIQCDDCTGQRFNEMVLCEKVTFGDQDLSIADFYLLTIQEVAAILSEETRLTIRNFQIAQRILQALIDVGLGYLPLGQPSTSLSGGEAQRVKLTRYLGQSKLSDRLIVLDEPSTGLHPQDLHGLLIVFDRLVRAGTTLVIVEHNSDIIRAADWIIDLGPDAGPEGGDILYMGEPGGLIREYASKTGLALKNERHIKFRTPDTVTKTEDSEYIKIQGARANNLKGIDVNIPKGKFTVVTSPSGSGKTSLVGNVLEAEARRRYLESMSMYERQGVREGPQAPVDSISGLGVTLTIKSGQAHQWSSLTQFTRRASVGRATELSHSLSVLLANLGECTCLNCGSKMDRTNKWICPECGVTGEIVQARHFSSDNYASACVKCTGVGVLLMARPDKLIIHPEKPLCRGAMYSPGLLATKIYLPGHWICAGTGCPLWF
jgi:excinuclease ABC subunit A